MARYAKFFSVGGGGGGTNNLQLPIGTVLDATLRQVQDGTGTGSPLYLSINRVGITSDPTVTTQTSSVIQATTTNASLVIAPNGTGALVANIPDGTTAGGNARGVNAVDLQMVRTASSSRVASGTQSFIGGGLNNQVTVTRGVVVGGENNLVLAGAGAIVGGENNQIAIGGGLGFIGNGLSNTVSSTYSVVSGGQSNTASSGTHNIVVGGQGNTSSGQHSISGGLNCVSSGGRSVAFGASTASGQYAISIGDTISASGAKSIALGADSQATQLGAVAIGNVVFATAENSFASGNRASAYLFGQNSRANGQFVGSGDSQQSLLTARREASLNSAATTVLSLDGTGTTNLIIPSGNNRLWAVKVVATAFVSVAGGTLVLGDSYMGEFTMLFKRVGGTSSVVGVNSANLIYDTNMATAAFTFAAGASQDLQITFKAPTTASATTFRCVAKVELVEVAY